MEGPSNGIATEHGVLWEFQRALQTRRVQVVLLCFTASEFHESQVSSEESWGFLRAAADFRRIYPRGDRVHPTLSSLEAVLKQFAFGPIVDCTWCYGGRAPTVGRKKGEGR